MPMRSTVRHICGHCGKDKPTDTGMCVRCHRFPTNWAPSHEIWEFTYDNVNDYHFIRNSLGYCFEKGITPALFYSRSLKALSMGSIDMELHWMMLGKITNMTRLTSNE